MAERATLITGWREAEDNLVKNVIQLSSALVALMTGFIAQTNFSLARYVFWLFSIAIILLGVSIAFGLTEQFLSSRAYLAQQKMLEQYYTKKISEFSEPLINRWVRFSQGGAFLSFALALVMIGIFAVLQAGDKTDVRQKQPTTATSSSPAAATTTTSSSPAAAAAAPGKVRAGQSDWKGRAVSGSEHAPSSTQKGVTSR